MADYLCLKKNEKFQIGGAYDYEHFYHLKFVLSKCINNTNQHQLWQPVCEDESKINKKDPNARIKFIFTNTILNPQNPVDPIKSYIDSIIFTVSPEQMITNSNVNLNLQKMSTDNSIMPYKQVINENFILFNNGDYKDSYSIGNYSNYCEIFFLRSPFSYNHMRTFLKLDQVISYVGGFCQIFIVIAALIVNQYNDYVFTIELANKLYDFDVNQSSSKLMRQNISQKRKTTSESQRNYLSQERFMKIKTNEETNLNLMTQNNTQNLQNTLMKTQSIEVNNQNNSKYVGRRSQKFGSYLISNNLTEKVINNTEIQKQRDYYDIYSNPTSPKYIKNQSFRLNELNQKLDQQINTETFKIQPFSINDINQLNLQTDNQLIDYKNVKQDKLTDIVTVQSKQKAQNIPRMQKCKSISSVNNNLPNNMQISHQVQVNKIQEIPSKFSINTPRTLNDRALSIIKKVFLKTSGYLDTKAFLEHELKPIIKRDRSIKLRFQFFINKLTCGKFFNGYEVQLLKKAADHVRSDLDLFTILDRLKELEKFKKVFLSEDQQSVFNFFPKPLINIHNEQKILSKYSFKCENSEIEKIKKQEIILKYFRTIRVLPRYIPIVQRAIQLFKQSIKQDQYSNYQKLYSCYEQLVKPANSEMESAINKKLIDLLGTEMRNIFGLTRQMKLKQIRQMSQTNKKSQHFIFHDKQQAETQEQEDEDFKQNNNFEKQHNNLEMSSSVAVEFKKFEQNPLSGLSDYIISKDHINIQITEPAQN